MLFGLVVKKPCCGLGGIGHRLVKFVLRDEFFGELEVGTAVVTRGDGRLALGRLGALCEQVNSKFES